MRKTLSEELSDFFAGHDFILHGKIFDDLVTFIESKCNTSRQKGFCKDIKLKYSTIYG